MTQLFCGAARRCITPPKALLGKLRGLKQHRFAGVLDDLYVRAIALGPKKNPALILSFDMTSAPCTEEYLEHLSHTLCIPIEQILFFSIHTHAVPFNSIDIEEKESQSSDTLEASKEYTRFLHCQAEAAAKEAVCAMQPARLGYAWGESFVNVVRLQDYTYLDDDGHPFSVCNLGADPSVPADRTLFTLRLEDLSGAPIAFLVNYGMHNVATIWNDMDGCGAMGISGDIGGAVSGLLEAENPGSVAVWSSSAAGDLNPVMLNEIILADPVSGRTVEYHPKGVETALMCCKVMSQRHYADIKKTLNSVCCLESDTGVSGVVEWSRTPGCDCIRHRDAPPEFITGPEVPEHTVRLQMVRIGSITFIGVGAELYSSIGQAILQAAPKNSVLITHNASTLCSSHYILDDKTIERCDASRGFAMVPGYDEYRCLPGVMQNDLCAHTRSMADTIERNAYDENL